MSDETMRDGPASWRLEPVGFADLPGWDRDDPAPLLPALSACRDHILTVKPYRTGAMGLTAGDLLILLDEATPERFRDAASARAFFEERCVPFRIMQANGKRGFVTGFYEPEVAVCDRPDDLWRFPFYRRPDDLVDIDDASRPAGLDPSYAFARRLADGSLCPYPDRGEIDRGFLAGRGLEIAWARSRVDVFFAHVQGAARLRFCDGSLRRITYAGKAGHPFSAVGRHLIDLGEIAEETVSMQSIRAWLGDHPERVDDILWHNRSYIFFREAPVEGADQGPVAAAKVPLVAGRSLAVDRLIHTFGFPFFIASDSLTHLDGGAPFARLMLALDTGSAIVGPARGDIFTGSGDEAGELAGTIRNHADVHILIPRAAAARFL